MLMMDVAKTRTVRIGGDTPFNSSASLPTTTTSVARMEDGVYEQTDAAEAQLLIVSEAVLCDVEKPSDYSHQCKALLRRLLVVVIFAVVVAVVVAPATVLWDKKDDTSRAKKLTSSSPLSSTSFVLTDAPSRSPSATPIWSSEQKTLLEDLLLPISGDRIYKDRTPRNKAFQWLIQSDLLGATRVDSKLVQPYVLAVLYFSTNGQSPWSQHLNRVFLSSADPCLWNHGRYGAFCINTSMVDEINLYGSEFSGTLPDELAVLTTLRTISMRGNKLYGTIPKSFGRLTMLETLDLSWNSLNGTLPEEMAALTALRAIDIQFNNLIGTMPQGFSKLSLLEKLNLNYNSLTGTIPAFVGELPSLKHFIAPNNFLEGEIPPFKNKQLLEIDLSGNRLNGILNDFLGSTESTELRFMGFGDNQLTGTLPKSIANFKLLSTIQLCNNNLTGSIPTELGLLTKLRDLQICPNEWSGIVPVELSNCTTLSRLDLGQCGLGGSFPSPVADLPDLDMLMIEGNNFANDLNKTFCNRADPINTFTANCLEDMVVCSCCRRCWNEEGKYWVS